MRLTLKLTACLSLLLLTSLLSPVDAADQKLVQAIEKAGGQAMQVAQDDPNLTVAFHLSDQKITDDTLAVIKGSPEIVELNLRGTEVTDAGMAHVGTLKNLKKLHLEKTKVTDAGLKHLAGLDHLEYLNLYGTAITDAGLEPLKSMKSLKKVFLWQTKVTDAGQEALENALADTYVNRGIDKVDYPLIADKPLAAFVTIEKEEEKPAEEKKEKKKEEKK
ncbi:MAG: hypothetical protein HUJ26_18320 [Planctomycetaceae bacterium]|nr:hypothetical protein [Planctomycetaceae bacterium]